MIKELIKKANSPNATPAEKRQAMIIAMAAAIGVFLLFLCALAFAWFCFSLGNEL